MTIDYTIDFPQGSGSCACCSPPMCCSPVDDPLKNCDGSHGATVTLHCAGCDLIDGLVFVCPPFGTYPSGCQGSTTGTCACMCAQKDRSTTLCTTSSACLWLGPGQKCAGQSTNFGANCLDPTAPGQPTCCTFNDTPYTIHVEAVCSGVTPDAGTGTCSSTGICVYITGADMTLCGGRTTTGPYNTLYSSNFAAGDPRNTFTCDCSSGLPSGSGTLILASICRAAQITSCPDFTRSCCNFVTCHTDTCPSHWFYTAPNANCRWQLPCGYTELTVDYDLMWT